MSLISLLYISIALFFTGFAGVFLNRNNIVVMLMSIELMLLSINLNFLTCSAFFDDLTGLIFALMVLTVAGAESAIGLALLVIYYRIRGTVDIEFLTIGKG